MRRAPLTQSAKEERRQQRLERRKQLIKEQKALLKAVKARQEETKAQRIVVGEPSRLLNALWLHISCSQLS